MCREHFEALESDFQRFYGIELAPALYGPTPLSVRRFYSLTRWLPADAAIWRATSTTWSVDNELQALTVELIDSLRRMYLQAHSKQGARLPDPIRVPRPWDTSKEGRRKSGTTLGEMIAVMGMQVRRGGEG